MIQPFAQALTVTALALLFWQGERPERICVALTVVALLVTPFVDHVETAHVRWLVAVVDAGLFGAYATLSLRYHRYWLIPLAGYQLIIVVTHIVPVLRSDYLVWTAVTVRLMVWVAMMFTVIFGAWEARQIRKHRLKEVLHHGEPAHDHRSL